MRGLKAAVWVALVAACVPVAASTQQETATVIGTVTDAQAAVLPGTTVTARNVNTGYTRSGLTDAEGRFRIAAVPPGQYELTAELPGFATTIRRGVTLSVGSEVILNFELSVARVAEEIIVTAESPVVETTTSSVQKTLNREQIDLLPLIGRDYSDLIRLTPGAVGTAITGSRSRSNQWYVDGVDNSEDLGGGERQELAIDAVQEVQVLVSGFKAEYGQATGGIINLITRSGTNVLRGSGLFLYRDQNLYARDPYISRESPEEVFTRIHYGATVGGPLVRDKLHYFATYEREDRDTFTLSTRTLPPANANYAPATRQFLAANGIDLGLFAAGDQNVTIRQSRPEYVNQHKATVRVDNQVNTSHALSFRYTLDHFANPSGFGGTVLDYNGGLALDRHNYGHVNHKWIVSGNKLNEAYVLFGQTHRNYSPNFPSLVNVSVTDGFTLGGPSNYPQRRYDYIGQFANNFTWHRTGGSLGDHAIKAGAQIKIYRNDGTVDTNFRGTFTFPSLAAFIAGQPSIFTQNQGNSNLARPNEIYGLYVQDDWRPIPSLTLSAGLRYDYESSKTQALRDVTGQPGPGISRDKNNWAPRLGFAWAPGNGTKQSFYGGTGLYYDQVWQTVFSESRFTPPKVIGIRIDTPSWPDPFQAGRLSNPLSDIREIDPELVTPHNWNSQVGYRRELWPDVGLDISYVHNRARGQIGRVNRNAGIRGSATLNGVNPRRPDPTILRRLVYTNLSVIHYDGLLVDVNKRFSHNVQGGLAYTLARMKNDVTDYDSDLLYPEHPELNYGPAIRPHRFRGHAEINLPWDLQLGAIVEFSNEFPLNITAARDLNGDGSTGEWVNERACVNIQCPGYQYSRNNVTELSTEEANRLRALFNLSPIAAFADNPKYFNVDATLVRRIRLGRNRSVAITTEAFNVFNIPQRNQPSQSITSAFFGRITSVDQPRAVQFTVQYYF